MIKFIRKKWNQYFGATGIILNYQGIIQRSPEFRSNVVSAENLDTHLQVLAAEWNVVPIADLMMAQRQQKLKKRMVALIFNTAYADDLDTTLNALKKYHLPAGFMCTEAVLSGDSISWEDELERLILYSRHLPPVVSLRFGEDKFSFDVSRETVLTDKIRAQYNDSIQPPLRVLLYQQLHERMQNCKRNDRLAVLNSLRNITSIVSRDVNLYRPATADQLRQIHADAAFSLGIQIQELSTSVTENLDVLRDQLETITGSATRIISIASPMISPGIVADLKGKGMDIIISRDGKAITHHSRSATPGSFLMKNYNLYTFRKHLQQWSKATLT